VRFDLNTGRGSLVNSVFANPERTLERDVLGLRWRAVNDNSWSLSLHPDLKAQLNEPTTTPKDPNSISKGWWADEAQAVLVGILNRAIELVKQGASVSYLMPEVVIALRAIAGSPAWDAQSEWLTGLRDITMSMVASGAIGDGLDAPWLDFALAIRAIEQGEPDKIHAMYMRR